MPHIKQKIVEIHQKKLVPVHVASSMRYMKHNLDFGRIGEQQIVCLSLTVSFKVQSCKRELSLPVLWISVKLLIM